MKNALLVSAVIHSLLFLLTLGSVTAQKASEEAVEVTMVEQQGNTDIPQEAKEEQIKELGEGEGEKPENYYWGLGIEGSLESYGFFIGRVYPGYSGEESGLQEGDVILFVNDLPLGNGNDIKGDTPKKLSLTILRKGVKIRVETERCKVYF